jgi:protein-S-isoprenylcysteine O-methyltransferase Ste14
MTGKATICELAGASPEIRRNVARRVAQVVVFDCLIALLMFVSAGRFDWLWAWVYAALMLGIQLSGLFVMPLSVIAERGSKKGNTETWDKVVTALIIPAFLGIFLVAGFEIRLQGEAAIPVIGHAGAVTVFLLGCALEIWAMRANRFFSTEVRIRFEHEHAVCSSGPYRFVRHPGYVGMILYYLVTPLFLGSWWAFVPAAVVVILFLVRTGFEDKTLHGKLAGYPAYAKRVRYRLIPGVW